MRLTLAVDDVSLLLGLVRGAIDECDEHLADMDGLKDVDEERAWYEERAARCQILAERLNAAGLRLT